MRLITIFFALFAVAFCSLSHAASQTAGQDEFTHRLQIREGEKVVALIPFSLYAETAVSTFEETPYMSGRLTSNKQTVEMDIGRAKVGYEVVVAPQKGRISFTRYAITGFEKFEKGEIVIPKQTVTSVSVAADFALELKETVSGTIATTPEGIPIIYTVATIKSNVLP